MTLTMPRERSKVGSNRHTGPSYEREQLCQSSTASECFREARGRTVVLDEERWVTAAGFFRGGLGRYRIERLRDASANADGAIRGFSSFETPSFAIRDDCSRLPG